MNVVIQLDLTTVPLWVWWATAAAVWYPLAGLVVRLIRRSDVVKNKAMTAEGYACLWAFSPLACLLLCLVLVVIGAYYTLWTAAHFASLGGVPAPWKTGWNGTTAA